MTDAESMTSRWDGPMPLHNLLIHVVGYVDRGCAACDWLRERGHIPPVEGES